MTAKTTEGLKLDHPQLYGRFSVMNGLRGITLFWVMFVHMPSFAVPGFLSFAHDHWRFGVDFFFAVSGFLVTRSLYQAYGGALKKGGPTLRAASIEYLIRRAARIMPPYFVVLGLVLGLGVAMRGGLLEALKESAAALPAWPLMFANYAIPLFEEKLPHALIILWSVSFQEQFYFLLLLFFLISRPRMKDLILASGLLSVALRLIAAFTFWKGQPRASYYEFWLHLNFDAISWGCLAWIYYDELGWLWATRRRAIATNIVMLLGNAFVIAWPSILPVENDQVQVLVQVLRAPFFALVARGVCELENRKDLVSRLLQSKWLGEIGIASYEIYLLHVLLFGVLDKLHVRNGPLFLAISYTVGVAAGMIFYRVFGKPSQEFAKTTLRRLFLPAPAGKKLATALR